MKYIVHRRFKGLAMCGETLNLPYGTELTVAGNFLVTAEGKAVCCINSENGHRHFAPDDDGKGLYRGALTYAIAYGTRRRRCRDGVYRFDHKERELLARDWGRFLQQDVDFILFNDEFFKAQTEELERLADALKIRR